LRRKTRVEGSAAGVVGMRGIPNGIDAREEVGRG
jgi:hypothetical protein